MKINTKRIIKKKQFWHYLLNKRDLLKNITHYNSIHHKQYTSRQLIPPKKKKEFNLKFENISSIYSSIFFFKKKKSATHIIPGIIGTSKN